jgi:hypothetical protein
MLKGILWKGNALIWFVDDRLNMINDEISMNRQHIQ